MRFAVVVLGLVACGGDGSITIELLKPATGDAFVRDQLGPTGAVSALVPVEVSVGGTPTRISLAAGPRDFGDLVDDTAIADIRTAGMVTLTVTAYDGDEVASTASVDVTVGDLQLTTCREWLDAFHIDYTAGPTSPGVVDPVTAKMPINGVPYRVVGGANPRTTMFGDCRLIQSLVLAAPSFRERDIAEVTDYGVYNYRCIGGGTPPNCPNGISQHAYAMAIDLAGFTTSDTTYFSVNDDWVIDPDAEDTCDAPTVEGKDRFLHELICELKAADVWKIVLTPNYNADHRNHFHVDLTPTSDFIERSTTPPVYGD
jgi:hypothetical protein